ncbi:MAG: phenylalanine--tRNA ligase subunit beta [Campylobacterota bacterium]
MIITKSWLEEFIDISEISTDEICKSLNSIGLEVDSVQKADIPSNVVIGKVLSKEKHPDADKLNICQVDVGEEKLQIVCGAKNVDKDQFVPVAKVGANLGDGFKIKKAKLRGVESIGMICSSTEIGLPKLNDGILELDDSIGKLTIGKELNEYKLLNDDIIEIELTANKGDCLSINGVARELSAYYNIPLKEFEKNVTYNEYGIGQVLEVECDSSIDSSVIYNAVDFDNYKLPLSYKLKVAATNKYIDKNDISNTISYITHSTGVILNAYSKDKTDNIKNLNLLHINKDKNGFDVVYGKEKLSQIAIEHKDIEPSNENFIIEASYIEPELLAKKVFETKVKTGEIYYRTSRGSEPNIEFGIDYFTTFVSKFGALVYKGAETFIEDKEKETLDVDINKVNSIIGQEIKKSKIERILKSLGFEVKDGANGILSIKIPLFRHDIKNIADITEEIVRIIGIDNIQAKPLMIDEVNRVNKTSIDYIKNNKLRYKAIENGFFETLTYVFASKEQLLKYRLPTVESRLDILNPIAKELDTFRTTIVLNLIEACSNNFKIGAKSTAFFEIGKVFNKKREESKKIAFIQTGFKEQESISNNGKPQSIDFFSFSKKILNTVGKFELEPMSEITDDLIHPYQNAKVIIDGKVAGFIAKLHPSVCEDFDLNDTFIAQIDFDMIKDDLVTVKKYSKFQSSKKDLSIIVPKSLEYKKIKDQINSLNDKNIKQFNLIDIYEDEKLGDNESLTIRFILQNEEKTLQDEDINKSMDNILAVLNEKLNLKLR